MPLRAVEVLTRHGIETIEPANSTIDRIGVKAYGLSTLPEAWSVPFFVIDANCDGSGGSESSNYLRQCLDILRIEANALVIVRSSGTKETMLDRGILPSEHSTAGNIFKTISSLAKKMPAGDYGRVHWVVQRFIDSRAIGQLSNERRVSSDNRDWILAVESHDGCRGATSRISVRPWRDGRTVTFDALATASELAISVSLKHVAKWATQFSDRMHFEWLWSGSEVYLVQADLATSAGGSDPRVILDVGISAVNCDNLQVFRLADYSDFKKYGKLANADLYRELGYSMPQFYVLDDQDVLKGILGGELSQKLRDDLVALTARPLIIRTDGVDIPKEKREMLPRSDELFTATQASNWLKECFTGVVARDMALVESTLCLIAHHFIPSVASAWARAEPRRSVVRIEALWGLPEGLYWYSHDTYEVDARSTDIMAPEKPGKLSYPFKKRVRYKGTYIAPDERGIWIPKAPAQPFDWRRVIERTQWLFEIARVTRQIAEREQQPTSVMWFVDNHRGATRHAVLPWFHSKCEPSEIPKAAPRLKYHGSRDFRVTTELEWASLRNELERPAHHIERVIVEPTEPSLIRNGEFARELGELARSKGFVVELSGGILSHAYYLLQKAGARVECVDLFGSEENVTEYNKVVRDLIADIIVGHGERAETVHLAGDALLSALKQKIVEESYEALDSVSGEELIGELADVLEVIYGICKALAVPFSRIDADRKRKRKKRGGFDSGLMLIRTATPPSLRPAQSTEPDEASNGPRLISERARLPQRAVYRHQDLRQPDEQEVEKQLTIEAELSNLTIHKEKFEFPFGEQGEKYSLTLDLTRERAKLRTVVKLRKGAVQLRFGFIED